MKVKELKEKLAELDEEMDILFISPSVGSVHELDRIAAVTEDDFTYDFGGTEFYIVHLDKCVARLGFVR